MPKLSACTKKICTHSNYFGWAQISLTMFKYGILSSKISLWTMCAKYTECVQNLLNMFKIYWIMFKNI